MKFYLNVLRRVSMDDKEFYQLRDLILKSGNYAVKKAQ